MRRPTHTMAGQRQGSKEGEAAQQEIVQEKARTDEGEAAISRRLRQRSRSTGGAPPSWEAGAGWARPTPELHSLLAGVAVAAARLGTTVARTALAASGCGDGGGRKTTD